LGLRLAANLTAGHLLLSIICSYCWEFTQSSLLFIILISPWLVLILLMIMEIAVTIIQAYVLTLLSSIYIKETLEIH
jgi:F-type H+-transporting ATPase subunit a